jgi:type IV pilus assembly protein PilA
MLLKLRKRLASEESGFTLVELLVVMLILGLLAAIAIPSFFNQRDKAKDAKAKEAVRTSQTAMETYATDHGGSYNDPLDPADAGALRAIEQTLNDADLTTVDGTTPANGYTLGVTSDIGTEFTIVRSGTGTVTFDCSDHGTAGCPSNGNWGG